MVGAVSVVMMLAVLFAVLDSSVFVVTLAEAFTWFRLAGAMKRITFVIVPSWPER